MSISLNKTRRDDNRETPPTGRLYSNPYRQIRFGSSSSSSRLGKSLAVRGFARVSRLRRVYVLKQRGRNDIESSSL